MSFASDIRRIYGTTGIQLPKTIRVITATENRVFRSLDRAGDFIDALPRSTKWSAQDGQGFPITDSFHLFVRNTRDAADAAREEPS